MSLPALFLTTILPRAAHAALTTQRFQHWSWYDDTLTNTLRGNCSSEYANYINQHDSHWYNAFPYSIAKDESDPWVYIWPVLLCLLEHTDELYKANMASGAVFLGLTPTILAVAGSTLAETTLLSTRRPLLAFLLAIGSPSVPPLRAFYFEDVPRMLERRKGGLGLSHSYTGTGTVAKALVVVVELAAASAAITNVLLVCFELGMKSFVTFALDVWFHPLMWSLFTGLLHLWGCLVFYRDVRILSPPPSRGKTFRQQMSLWAQDEFSPCKSHTSATDLEYKPDTPLFLFLSWWSSVLILLHYIFGTVVFASVLFVSTPEALIVVARLLASALCCRLIVTYELSGMRQVAHIAKQ